MNPSKANKIISWLSFGIVFFVPTTVWAIREIDKYKEWSLFSAILVLSGLCFGFIFSRLLSLFYPILLNHSTQKGVKLVHITSFMGALFFFYLGIFINERYSSPPREIKYKILKISSSRRTNHLTIVSRKGEIERFTFGDAYIETIEEQDSVLFHVSEGYLGFSFKEIL